jgi:hypothetical protein
LNEINSLTTVGFAAFGGSRNDCPLCAALRREITELRRQIDDAERRTLLARSQPEAKEGRYER